MQAHRIDSMFRFNYIKSSAEIIAKMTIKVDQLKGKISERKKRIHGLREEYKITDAIYIELLEQAREAQKSSNMNKMSYSVSNSQTKGNGLQEGDFVIGAGVVNHLLTENDFAKNEEAQVERMELIIRNLKDLPVDKHGNDDPYNQTLRGHHLSEEELKFLGF